MTKKKEKDTEAYSDKKKAISPPAAHTSHKGKAKRRTRNKVLAKKDSANYRRRMKQEKLLGIVKPAKEAHSPMISIAIADNPC